MLAGLINASIVHIVIQVEALFIFCENVRNSKGAFDKSTFAEIY